MRVWLQSLKKVLKWPKKFILKKSKKVSKNAEFHADFESVEKVVKKCTKTSVTNMSKSEKSAFFPHIFANNYFWVHFFKTFSTDSKSDTFVAFFKQNFFFRSYLYFFQTLIANAQETAQKNGNLFL